MKKNILFIEPFFSGSHASWLKQLCKHSSHNIKLLTMEGRSWKWRMYGAAVTMAEKFLELDFKPDLIIATDMLDLSTFLSLVRKDLSPSIPIAIYFHENQMAYPWSDKGKDKENGWDINYGFINYNSALSADHIFFNSKHNMDSFYTAMESLLKKMPDNKHMGTISGLYDKSSILPIGIELKSIDSNASEIYYGKDPLIVWNHRWEFDKNPHDFFKALMQLKKEGLNFKLALLGETYKNKPKIIEEALNVLKDDILVTGFLTGAQYASWLKASHIAPVTSNHDFFGISVMETVYAGCIPLLPKRLTYPDLYKIEENPEIFYESYDELVNKLRNLIANHPNKGLPDYKHLAHPYDWSNLIKSYDELFNSL